MLTNKQQNIKDRREVVSRAYKSAIDNKEAISPVVATLAKKYKVSQVTIYGDINYLGLSKKIA